ncbi:uncharacterized protein LOC132196188 isoform X3 [Neocloeon triangulifer]|uniref:uncharacterized protein LOC132196188 isoform X3 n=1 Tax=Neocloeon triangulifer TaxID=2078957 RepID=UPI00286F5B2F|nr:uncharacterized protein LOC132196188 isoform X3 [Neocloeon triangulifer]
MAFTFNFILDRKRRGPRVKSTAKKRFRSAGKDLWVCKLCRETIPGGGGTTNMWGHLRAHHPPEFILCETERQQLIKARLPAGQPSTSTEAIDSEEEDVSAILPSSTLEESAKEPNLLSMGFSKRVELVEPSSLPKQTPSTSMMHPVLKEKNEKLYSLLLHMLVNDANVDASILDNADFKAIIQMACKNFQRICSLSSFEETVHDTHERKIAHLRSKIETISLCSLSFQTQLDAEGTKYLLGSIRFFDPSVDDYFSSLIGFLSLENEDFTEISSKMEIITSEFSIQSSQIVSVTLDSNSSLKESALITYPDSTLIYTITSLLDDYLTIASVQISSIWSTTKALDLFEYFKEPSHHSGYLSSTGKDVEAFIKSNTEYERLRTVLLFNDEICVAHLKEDHLSLPSTLSKSELEELKDSFALLDSIYSSKAAIEIFGKFAETSKFYPLKNVFLGKLTKVVVSTSSGKDLQSKLLKLADETLAQPDSVFCALSTLYDSRMKKSHRITPMVYQKAYKEVEKTISEKLKSDTNSTANSSTHAEEDVLEDFFNNGAEYGVQRSIDTESSHSQAARKVLQSYLDLPASSKSCKYLSFWMENKSHPMKDYAVMLGSSLCWAPNLSIAVAGSLPKEHKMKTVFLRHFPESL